MGLVVRISNLLIQKGESEALDQESGSNDENQDTSSDKSQKSVSEFLAKKENTTQWHAWVEGGLKKTNEINSRTLGAPKNTPYQEDEDSEFDEREQELEKTSKLISFSQMVKSFRYSSNDDQEEEEELDTAEDKDEEDNSEEPNFDLELRQEEQEEPESKLDDGLVLSFDTLLGKEAIEPIKALLPPIPELQIEFLDNTYWRINEQKTGEVDIDALLVELEA